jgi:hypothetical protein
MWWGEGGGGDREPVTGIDPTGNPGLGGTYSDPVNDPGISGVGGGLSWCTSGVNTFAMGLVGGALSGSNPSRRSRDAAGAFLVTFASMRTSGLPRTAIGAASAKLMVESIRRIRVSIRCCRIFVGYVTEIV